MNPDDDSEWPLDGKADGPATELILEELRHIREALDTIEEAVAPSPNEEDQLPRKYRVLRDVYERGGVVPKEEWHEIGREHGYDDARGLAGLFAHGTIVRMISGNRVALTERAEENLIEKGIVEG